MIKRIFALCLSLCLILGCFAGAVPASASGSAYVYSFAQLKDNLEDPNITDIYVYTQENTLPWYGHDGDPYQMAITVVGAKHLHLEGKAIFRVPDIPTDDYIKYSSLIHVPAEAALSVDGEGSMDFDGRWANCTNAVIYNEGTLVIRNADLAGVCSETNASACAIWHRNGALTIHDGDFYGVNSDPNVTHWGAVRLLAPATIQGGYFRSALGVEGAYGLMIPSDTTGITIAGGTFRGICLPTQTTPFANYVPSKYTCLRDGSWFNPQSEYSQDYVRSSVVKVVNWIREINVSIKPPMEGVALDYNPVVLTDGYHVATPVWYCNGVKLYREDDPVAKAGSTYSVKLYTKTMDTDSYEFASTGNLKAYINGTAATISESTTLEPEEGNVVELNFGTCKNLVDVVHVSVTAPEELERVRFTASVTNTELCTVLSNVKWYENGSEIFSGAAFREGKSYSVAVEIKAESGCEFPLDELGNPSVYCRVNGYDAEVFAVEGKDPAQYAQVRFDFGQCNDSIIEHIAIAGITPPVPGEHPSYNATVQGSGYYIDTSKNSYYDAYWKNPPEKWYYVKNGVSWWDVTDGGYEYVYEHDVFLPGHEYECQVHVHTEDGYEFVYDLYTDPETWPTVTVNGNSAGLTFHSASGLQWEQEVEYTFPVEPAEIESVTITDLDHPVAGQEGDYTATLGNPYLYAMDTQSGFNGCGIWWEDENENYVVPGYHTFQAGQTYHLQIRVAANTLESGELVGRFAEDVAVNLEGYTVDRVRVWDEIIIVDAYYQCPAEDIQGGTVSGNIGSFGSNEPVTLQLIAEGTSEPAYEEYGRESYSFTNIPNGKYTLVVSKKNHVPRSYSVTVTDGKVSVYVQLSLVGDVTGDGEVDVADTGRVYAHVKGTSPLTDEYALAVADVTGDGEVNIADTGRIYAHVKNTSFLW